MKTTRHTSVFTTLERTIVNILLILLLLFSVLKLIKIEAEELLPRKQPPPSSLLTTR
jgi:hypothetical protein